MFTATTKRVYLPCQGHFAHFVHRDVMRKRGVHPTRTFAPRGVPATTLPVDSTANGACSCPMDGNDSLGDCGEAMACHADNILTYGQGKPGFTESAFDLTALEKQYEQVSGGDNGLDEDMVVNQIWKVGIAGNKQAVIVDALDIDVTNVPLAQFALDWFYTIEMAWSVPDAFISSYAHGAVYAAAGAPDDANGHFTPLSDIFGPADKGPDGTPLNGFYRLWTWGDWCIVSPAFVASVGPQCFVVFSPRQFDAQGYDSKGRHITQVAAMWVLCGGNAIPASVIASFPPAGPTPSPTPAPAPAPAVLTGSLSLTTALPAGQLTVPGVGAIDLDQAVPNALYDLALTAVTPPAPPAPPTPVPPAPPAPALTQQEWRDVAAYAAAQALQGGRP